MNAEPQRTCPSCGNELPGAIGFCPVCMLRGVLGGGGPESDESSASQDMDGGKDSGLCRIRHKPDHVGLWIMSDRFS